MCQVSGCAGQKKQHNSALYPENSRQQVLWGLPVCLSVFVRRSWNSKKSHFATVASVWAGPWKLVVSVWGSVTRTVGGGRKGEGVVVIGGSEQVWFVVQSSERDTCVATWTVVLEKALESPLDGKEIQPVHPKGDQPWVFFGRNDAKAETPVLWPPHVKSWLIGEDSDAGRDSGQEGDDGGWDGWMASLTRWTWVWVNSGSWWWTGRPGVLQSMGSQRVGHDWVTELKVDLNANIKAFKPDGDSPNNNTELAFPSTSWENS